MTSPDPSPAPSDPLVARAQARCIAAHAGQKRDDGQPYHVHPHAVAELTRAAGFDDPELLAAAYLHDVLEDTPVTAEELTAEFGPAVVAIVQELTNIGPPGRSFEEKHRALAEHARRMSPAAKVIKLADRLNNLSEMHVWSPKRQQRYALATVDLLAALEPIPAPALAERIRALIAPYTAAAT